MCRLVLFGNQQTSLSSVLGRRVALCRIGYLDGYLSLGRPIVPVPGVIPRIIAPRFNPPEAPRRAIRGICTTLPGSRCASRAVALGGRSARPNATSAPLRHRGLSVARTPALERGLPGTHTSVLWRRKTAALADHCSKSVTPALETGSFLTATSDFVHPQKRSCTTCPSGKSWRSPAALNRRISPR